MELKVAVVQLTANATIVVEVPTMLTVDGKTGWNILGLHVSYPQLGVHTPMNTNSSITLKLNTETGIQSFPDNDNILTQNVMVNGSASSASTVQLQPNHSIVLPSPRLTVQPILYLQLASTGATAPVQANVTLFYETQKLTDLEVMRLLQGGA